MTRLQRLRDWLFTPVGALWYFGAGYLLIAAGYVVARLWWN